MHQVAISHTPLFDSDQLKDLVLDNEDNPSEIIFGTGFAGITDIKEGVVLLPPERTAVNPTVRPSGEPYSATAFRNALGDPENNKDEIAEFVGEENVDNVLKILGLSSNMEEQASMGGGGVAIGTAPLASGSGKKRPAKRDKKKRTDEKLKLANEVMRLIIERGILK